MSFWSFYATVNEMKIKFQLFSSLNGYFHVSFDIIQRQIQNWRAYLVTKTSEAAEI
jgi:hypothetical protein